MLRPLPAFLLGLACLSAAVGADPELIFRTPYEERWDRSIRSLGIDPHLLAEGSGNA